MHCAQIKYFWIWFKSGCTMTHMVPPKCYFHTSTCTIMLSLSLSCLKKYPSMSNSCLFMKITQTVKRVCWFELPYTPILPNLLFYKWYPILSKWIISKTKSMFKEQCVMLMVITDIEWLLLIALSDWRMLHIPLILTWSSLLNTSTNIDTSQRDSTHFVSNYEEQCVVLRKIYHW